MASVAEDGIVPEVAGQNLEGESYELPGDFEGDLNLLLVAFRREQQADVDTWLPVARRLGREYPSIRYYELPVIDRLYRLARPFIDGGMRAGIADATARERTITLYVDAAAFRQSLDLPTRNAIYALLVDREGEVHWGSRGRRTDAAERTLADVIDEHLDGG